MVSWKQYSWLENFGSFSVNSSRFPTERTGKGQKLRGKIWVFPGGNTASIFWQFLEASHRFVLYTVSRIIELVNSLTDRQLYSIVVVQIKIILYSDS